MKKYAALFILTSGLLQGASIQATFDTSGLPAGDYALDLQMADGDGMENNSVTFKNFLFNGLVLNLLSLTGTATGTIGSSIVITDGDPTPDPFSGALQTFSVTGGLSSIAFVLSYSEAFAGGFPDAIFMGILDSTFATLASLMVDLADPTVVTAAPGNGVTVTAVDGSVPEPGLAWLVAAAAFGIAVRGRRLLNRQ